MHNLILIMATCGLVLLQTTQGQNSSHEQDTDVYDELKADGFILNSKVHTKTEKPLDNYNDIITHDSLNPKANLSVFQKDSLPIVTIGRNPEASRAHIAERQTIMLSPEENAEGSGMFSEIDTSMTNKETAAEVNINSNGSSNKSRILNIPEFATEENVESGMGPEDPTSDPTSYWSTISTIAEEPVNVVKNHIEIAVEKPESSPEPTEKVSLKPKSRANNNYAKPPISAVLNEGTPEWLIIVAFCLTLGAVLCVILGIATRDKWYGPCKQLINTNSTEPKKCAEYDNATTVSLSEKEKEVLMSTQMDENKEKDFTIISLQEGPEREYLM